ncbi:MAG: peptidylprolyl isomerase, partial [Oscillospiraceae bacterium]
VDGDSAKKKYSAKDEGYEESAEIDSADAVFKYKKEQATNKWLVAALCVAIVAVSLLGLFVFLPKDSGFHKFFDNIFNSTPLTRNDTVMTIGDEKISPERYLNVILGIRDELEGYYPGFIEQNPKAFANLKQIAEDQIKGTVARQKWATDLGIELTDDEIAKLDEYIAESKSSYKTDAEYLTALNNSYLTEELYKTLMTEQQRAYKLLDYLNTLPEYSKVTDEEAKTYVGEKGIMRAKHILIVVGKDATEEVRAEKLKLANDILAKLGAGEDFDTLMKKYSEDPGLQTYPQGYTFGPGDMVPEFEEGTKALALDGISEIVESTNGYHIIKRLEPIYTEIYPSVVQDRIEAKVAEYTEALKVKFARGYDKITLDQLKWNQPAPIDQIPADNAPADGTTDAPADGTTDAPADDAA